MSEDKKKPGRKPLFGKNGKMGVYTVVITLLVLAGCVALNLIASAVPATYTQIDSSSNKLFTLSAATKTFVSSIDQDVTLYYICEGGREDAAMRTFLARYEALSSHISVKTVDPVKDPSFLEKIGVADADNYAVAVVSDKRTKTVNYNDMYYYYNDQAGKLSVDEYNQYASYYGAYMESYFGTFTEFFGGDAQITGAIEYVTAERIPVVYMLEGHSESEFTATLTDNVFTYSGVTYKKINIAMDDSGIPDDCDLLIVNVPSLDLSAGEAQKLASFFDAGGHVLLITGTGCDALANLMSFTQHCGLSAVPGTVSEGDTSKYYSRNPQFIYPEVNSEHTSTAGFSSSFSNYPVLVPYAHAIALTGAPGVTTTSLLSTSSKASISDSTETAEYSLCASAEKDGAKLVWIGSSQMLSDQFINGTNGGNLYCFYFMFRWLHNSFASGLPEIAQVDLTPPTLTVSESQANLWGSLFIFIVPGALLAGGLIFWLRRRRK